MEITMEKNQDIYLIHFQDPRFRQAFQQYFGELGIQVKDWEGLFQEIEQDTRGTRGWLRLQEGNPQKTVGFIMFCPMELSSWFFTKKAGFIREFWVAEAFRGQGHGSQMLGMAEQHLLRAGMSQVMLTTNTAENFYLCRGYRRDPGYTAKNGDPVLVKDLHAPEEQSPKI